MSRKPSVAALPRTLLDSLRYFLTPAVWKQAQPAAPRRKQRWSLQPVVLVLLAMTWGCGDSEPERFETARAFAVVCLKGRKRPGRTLAGFQKALARLPLLGLRLVAAGVRRRLQQRLGRRWQTHGFVVLGCDGSRLECPRTVALEQRLGQCSKDSSAPMVWLTALVHLATGTLWSWQLGRGTASELVHLSRLLLTLPAGPVLLVADAAYISYALLRDLVARQASFVIRLSSRVWLYTEQQTPLQRWREGVVYYWPKEMQAQRRPPVQARLIRVRGKHADVWLLTNVLDRRRLSRRQAAQFYRWRWRNEGLFRTYKRTLAKVKLHSRSVRLVHREAEGSLLAVQLLLAQGAVALAASATDGALPSPRQILVEIRRELAQAKARAPGRRPGGTYGERLRRARCENRSRASPKASRGWPRRKDHKPPKPPRMHTLTKEQKALATRMLHAA